MNKAFVIADNYRSKFEPYKKFYDENEKLITQGMEETDHGWLIMNLRTCYLYQIDV